MPDKPSWAWAVVPLLLIGPLYVASFFLPPNLLGPLNDVIPVALAAAVIALVLRVLMSSRTTGMFALVGIVCAALGVSVFWPRPWLGDSVFAYVFVAWAGFTAVLMTILVGLRVAGGRAPGDRHPVPGGDPGEPGAGET